MQAQPHHTSWRTIALAIFAALNAAFQIGKAIIALPLLQGAPLHLSLRETGLVISSLAIVAVSYTHLDVYKRQGRTSSPTAR